MCHTTLRRITMYAALLHTKAVPHVLQMLVAVAAALPLVTHAQIVTPQLDTPMLLSVTAASEQTEIDVPIDVAQLQESRLLLSNVRATTNADQLALIDPIGVRVWSAPASAVATPRSDTARPELGESYLVPEVRDPVPGKWILRLSRAPARANAGKVIATYVLLDRFQILMAVDARTVRPRQPIIVRVSPTDYGAPMSSLQLQLNVRNAAGEPVFTLPLSEGLKNSAGIALTNEPGAYLARVTFPGAGRYVLDVSSNFRGRRGSAHKSARKMVEVTGDAPTLQLVQVETGRVAPANCIGRVKFHFVVGNGGPAATYVLRVAPLAGNPIMFSATAPNSGSNFKFTITAEAGALRRLGSTAALHTLHAVSLLRFGKDVVTLAAEWPDVVVTPPVALADLCGS
jgi:hypothetical protein